MQTLRVRVDGRDAASAAASGPLRVLGDGAFETIGVWGGRPFRLEAHLERLNASRRGLDLEEVDLDTVAADVDSVCDGYDGDAALRLYAPAGGPVVVVLAELPGDRPTGNLVPMPAPWIQPADVYPPGGAKTMSYAPHNAATRRARRHGGDDALLLSHPEAFVLEGATFAVCWLVGETLYAPDPMLGCVDSVTRREVGALARDQGLALRLGSFRLVDLAAASEVLACSTLRGVRPVTRIGGWQAPGASPVTDALAAALERRRRAGGSRTVA